MIQEQTNTFYNYFSAWYLVFYSSIQYSASATAMCVSLSYIIGHDSILGQCQAIKSALVRTPGSAHDLFMDAGMRMLQLRKQVCMDGKI